MERIMTMEIRRFADVFDAIAESPAEAASLKARGDLMSDVIAAVRHWDVTQQTAAKRLGITRPRLNDLMRGKIHKFSLDALVDIATAAGLDVTIGTRIHKAA
jgi:predicted XRE-type DNA-binding protein